MNACKHSNIASCVFLEISYSFEKTPVDKLQRTDDNYFYLAVTGACCQCIYPLNIL